jgi:N-acetylmuramoyl-L-alanine amidase
MEFDYYIGMDSSPKPSSQRSYWPYTLILAAVLATAFITFAPASLSPDRIRDSFAGVLQPTAARGAVGPIVAFNLPIGIVAGHSGNDSGAICDDGLTEASINTAIANQVRDILMRQGYKVDMLQEFDPRLTGYKALALVSIHADSCMFINDEATGFKVASSMAGTAPESSTYLSECIKSRYATRTGLPFHAGSITSDMTSYHAYTEVDPSTPAAIIETGFMFIDRIFLTQHSDQAAQGIADGILCFTRNEPLQLTIPTP